MENFSSRQNIVNIIYIHIYNIVLIGKKCVLTISPVISSRYAYVTQFAAHCVTCINNCTLTVFLYKINTDDVIKYNKLTRLKI